jgi:hypothetical protein
MTSTPPSNGVSAPIRRVNVYDSFKKYITNSWDYTGDHNPSTITGDAINIWVCILVVSLAISCGMFFGLNYPQILINKYYVPAHCTITNATIVSRYCPSVSCSSCTDAPGTPSCSSVTAFQETLNPQTCGPNSTQSCASGTACNTGYSCCSTCCSTCTSCSTSCTSGTGSSFGRAAYRQNANRGAISHPEHILSVMEQELDTSQCNVKYMYNTTNIFDTYFTRGDVNTADVNCTWTSGSHTQNKQISAANKLTTQGCTTSCYPYSCDCYCCSSVNYLSCYATPNICYTDVLQLIYDNQQDKEVTAQYSKDQGQDLGTAQNYITSQYVPGHTYGCYYDLRDSSNILWSIAYNVGYWVGTCIFMFILFISVIVVSHPALVAMGGCNVKHWLFHTGFIWLWVGIIIPFAVLLPVYLDTPISKEGRISVLVLVFQFITIGPIPYVYCRWNLNIFLVYAATIWGGAGWATPFAGWYVGTLGGIIPSCIGIILFTVYVMWQTDLRVKASQRQEPVPIVTTSGPQVIEGPPPAYTPAAVVVASQYELDVIPNPPYRPTDRRNSESAPRYGQRDGADYRYGTQYGNTGILDSNYGDPNPPNCQYGDANVPNLAGEHTNMVDYRYRTEYGYTTTQYPEGGNTDAPNHHYGEADTYDSRYDVNKS